MKKLLVLLMFLPLFMYGHEGMWLPGVITPETRQLMKELGIEMTPEQLYNPNGTSLCNAIVSLGGGFCSGVVVSPDGLIFTNHHCGFGSIQEHSSVEHDYLKYGFAARSFKEELPNPDLFISFLVRSEDVTNRVLGVLPKGVDEARRTVLVDSISQIITNEALQSDSTLRAKVSPFYGGSEYYLAVYKDFNDVRLVFAPPSSAGKFGGDTDNWMWPRHTCDFSVFRIYANKNNEPSNYSEDNVPYHPTYYAPVSLKGYQQGSFCMTMGYPGSTSRYLSSYGVEERIRDNMAMIDVRTVKLDIIKKAMESSDKMRIMYSSKFANSSNYWKNSIGMNKAIKELSVIEKKQALENSIQNWIDKKKKDRAEYKPIFKELKENYEGRTTLKKANTYLVETYLDGPEIITTALQVMMFDNEGSTDEERTHFRNQINNIYKDYDLETDKKLFIALVDKYKANVDTAYLLPLYKDIDEKYNGSTQAFADYLYSNSDFTSTRALDRYFSADTTFVPVKDPAGELAVEVIGEYMKINGEMAEYKETIKKDERLLTAALRAMESDKDFYPDANSTMRLSFGMVGGYDPKDGVHNDFFTTTKGIFEKQKEADENADYEVLDTLLNNLKKRDFGRYGTNGDMNVCFISDNDITGGNSGSGMFNGKGELIGLAFDGNWEAMSGDLVFEPNLQRCIGVDIRYVLYIIDKYAKDTRLIKELKLMN